MLTASGVRKETSARVAVAAAADVRVLAYPVMATLVAMDVKGRVQIRASVNRHRKVHASLGVLI
jgi:hypothetical protein